ncbi:hypothetical protein COB11_01730, partial [Candidatus Aerophobetes bacterium]
MSTADRTAEKKAFRLSMLIYDTRYRSITIQVIALIALALLYGCVYLGVTYEALQFSIPTPENAQTFFQ